MALGGLSQILRNLLESFHFDAPRPAELKGVPTWEIVGRWKSERYADLFPGQEAALQAGRPPPWDQLGEHLPDSVVLTLGRDQNFPLLPYRIEYQRARRRQGLTGGTIPESQLEPMVTMEFFEVRHRPDLTPADFTYQPSDQRVEDLTGVYLRRLGLPETAR
jgi:hypothetical protein